MLNKHSRCGTQAARIKNIEGWRATHNRAIKKDHVDRDITQLKERGTLNKIPISNRQCQYTARA